MKKFIWAITLVDMTPEMEDVVGVGQLVATTPQEASQKAAQIFQSQGLIKQDVKYFMHAAILGELPNQGPQIIVPKMQVPPNLKKEK